MNACIRAVVRRAWSSDVEVIGVRNGFEGLIQGDFFPMSLRSVGNIIQRGGTILGSSRSKAFRSKVGRQKAYKELQAVQTDGLIVLGGDGSIKGGQIFSQEFPIKLSTVPCTIDNDLWGTDLSIGFESAAQTIIDCVDKVRDTADSHGRVFLIEVMGRHSGHLALATALGVGAEYVVVPERRFRIGDLVKKIKAGIQRGKTGSIIIVSEGERPGLVLGMAEQLTKKLERDVRSLVLGHLQRGGGPSVNDRNLASEFGSLAVDLLLKGKNRRMAAVRGGKLCDLGLEQVLKNKKTIDLERLKLIEALSV